jgi:hypothetical protein
MLVKILQEVPNELLQASIAEINQIDWENRPQDPRAKFKAFAHSQTIHLRTHKKPDDWTPTTIDQWSTILECVDNPLMKDKFNSVRTLANWIFSRVDGVRMGRIMIINLVAGGEVPLHIDPLDYFERYSRYHVPVKTNPGVVFSGSDGVPEHMPWGYLCRLNNRLPHRLDNRSEDSRIHILVDIETPDGNAIF